MRRVENPPNPFLSQQREWLAEPPTVMTEVFEEIASSILSENDSPDIPFRWGVNPYRGCQHACAYCYARPTHEYLGHGAGTDFESKIVVKVNAPELLRREFAKPSWRREQVAFSGVTDCYQPLEAVYQLTRRCLEVCRDAGNPVGIVTKSFLVVRDVSLLAELDERAGAMVFISIPFADDQRGRLIEPGAPPPSRRFEALRRLRAAGISAGVMVAPVIPGLNDRELPAILERAADCGALTAGFQALRLPGSVKAVFLSRLRAALPEAAERIEARIRDMRDGALSDPRFGHRMTGVGQYWQSVRLLFETMATKYGLAAGQRWRKPPARAADRGRHIQLPLFHGES